MRDLARLAIAAFGVLFQTVPRPVMDDALQRGGREAFGYASHLHPGVTGAFLLLAAALLAEASLSFLGLGIQPPDPSWGAMLARAYQYMEIAPEQMYAPGLAILVVSLAFNALGESLRVVLDPTMKDR